MSNFFSFPTVNSWDENVFQLTTAGIITVIVLIILLIGAALFARRKTKNPAKTSVKQLTFSAVAMALAIVTSMIKLFELPMGGSVTLLSMLFITLIGYWYGPCAGLMTGFAYGLLQFVMDPVYYSIPQMICDYPLAFGALGLSGLFANKKYGLQLGYVAGVLGRFVFAWLSGVLFFAAYAEGSGMIAPVYSAAYNGSYLATEGIITLILISIPPVASALKRIKKMAAEN